MLFSPASAQPAVAPPPPMSKATRNVVIVAALGYFVDVYDLLLFGIVRKPSLEALGFTGDALLREGAFLINVQMAGILLGGILWGVLGDLRGRRGVLFGSILLYSLANVANGFVTDIPTYAVLRFVAGIGLAGELGAGVTLVSEMMHREHRGLGTMAIAAFGMLGAVAAGLVGDMFDWRTAYFVGGGLGLMLLFLRMGVMESGMFETAKGAGARRGAFFSLFTSGARAKRYLACIGVGLPVWYTIGLLVFFAPEIARELGVRGEVTGGRAVLFCYVGLAPGDILSGWLSQRLRSRKRAMLAFIVLLFAVAVVYLTSRGLSAAAIYGLCVALGFFAGYWAVFMANASEQFGTNLRATVTTTVPNFVRGAVVPITTVFLALTAAGGAFALTRPTAALAIGAVCTAIALVSLYALPERFDADLDYVEHV